MRPRKLAWKSRFQKAIERIEFTKFRNPTVNDITWFPWQIYLEISLLFQKKEPDLNPSNFHYIYSNDKYSHELLTYEISSFTFVYKSKLEIQMLILCFFFPILSRIISITGENTSNT